MIKEEIVALALRTIEQEKQAVEKLSEYVDNQFAEIVELLFGSEGRFIVTGIGKSAIIANKIVATLNSTGTPAVFMHAADAIHGDLGIVQQSDIVMCISKSGNSPEIKVLIPYIKNMGNKVIGMVGNLGSFLAQNADYIINTTVEKEACLNNLAPTTSTTAQLVMGDALAVCLLGLRGFSPSDFARYHPGGALGKRLYTRVRDVVSLDSVPYVGIDSSLSDIIMEITSNRLGATAVLDEQKQIMGIVTDGDLRRMLMQRVNLEGVKARDIMSLNPKSIEVEQMAISAHEIMESNKITQLLVVDNGAYVGIIHIHDLLKEGVV